MSKEKMKLGKGLEALIPKSYLSQGKTIVQLPISEIDQNPFQPRTIFDDDKIQGLSDSIKQYGLNQPILVRKTNNRYQLIAGERRFRACILAKLQTVPSIIKNVSDKQSLEIALIENLEREDLNPIDEAKGYRRLIQEFNFTHSDLARLSKSKTRSTISNILRLLKLPSLIQDALVSGDITAGHGRALLSFDDEEEMINQYRKIVDRGVNVRDLESVVKSKKKKVKVVLSPYLKDVSSKLSNHFDSKVLLKGSEKKGSLVLSYSSQEGLLSLLSKLGL